MQTNREIKCMILLHANLASVQCAYIQYPAVMNHQSAGARW